MDDVMRGRRDEGKWVLGYAGKRVRGCDGTMV